MRPEILFPLFAPVTRLPGIGPRLEKLYERLAGPHVVDLLWHLPTGIIDRRFRPPVSEVKDGEIATLAVTVELHVPPPPRNNRVPYRVWVSDGTGEMSLVFFRARADYIQKMLPEAQKRLISGKVDFYQGQPQMTHPDHIVAPENEKDMPLIEAVYPLTQGLTQKQVQKAAANALAKAPVLAEWLDPAWKAKNAWPDWQEAIKAAHAPESEADLAPEAPARARLAYDELLSNQLALALVRLRMRARAGRPVKGDGRLRAKVEKVLPFALTGAQKNAIAEIDADLASNRRMLRLLQGDVGSGKTLVGLMAMLSAIESGAQAALMAPTEILARQHAAGLAPLCEAAGVTLALLTGREKGKSREAVLSRLQSGEIDILVGTHALFQEDVHFKDLAVAVVDEQHRFGVHQRMQLQSKGGAGTNVLVMTATPIPRTLTLTAYGDMDVSRLTEKPPGRQPIDTRLVSAERLHEVVEAVRRAMQSGARVYWVCRLVEESDVLDVAAAEERYGALSHTFGDKVGIVHGRMRAAEKDAVMAKFQSGEISLLVATTVIEVGVDVPEATVMVIEHAERFGLAQLHQLRGRVGRGSGKSTCLLLYHGTLGETAKARLKIMRDTEDGFIIAEEDLRLRGAGELLGTRQSGMPEFRLADITAHRELLSVAYDDARLIMETDPELEGARGEALRTLLYLFERDEAIRYLRSG
ncbi:ATP-dependent DNA helicase RecG [Tepidicaulis marinus]|uniref:ATP-dependent DNA helicase RecG n=1 Tax=Tepidicaulis marinus TaxID=1333998 RepID=A0A081B7D0_9HYPH|nr:ATP-dependent DNA helicase RecG [Tepidicaulis marinus]GAK43948.1 ATP-dependent DNA helicase RecG [Tepidicaulis marinus]